ncbi:MAG: hypothetical protein ABSF69_19560 [Polyangiaceae bacterium]
MNTLQSTHHEPHIGISIRFLMIGGVRGTVGLEEWLTRRVRRERAVAARRVDPDRIRVRHE